MKRKYLVISRLSYSTLMKPIDYRTVKILPLIPILNHLKEIRIAISYLFKINFGITLSPTPKSPK